MKKMYIVSVQVFFLTFLLLSCENSRAAGIAITFDDSTVDEWYSIKDMLHEYDAKVTFFVSRFHFLDDTKIQYLQDLKSEGHEIACHGLNHIHAVDYIESGHTIDEYLQIEIFPALESMRSVGLFPSSFAYPYGQNNAELDSELLEHFDYVRDTAHTELIVDLDKVFFDDSSNRLLYGAGIDNSYDNPLIEIEDALDRALENDEVLIVYAHKPTDESGDYHIPLDKLEGVLQYASSIGVEFHTVSDLRAWKVSLSGTNSLTELNRSGFEVGDIGFGDFDGSGTTDVIRATGYEWRVSWDGMSSWEYLNTIGNKLNDLGFGDFNGDGSTDIIRTDGSTWYVSWSGTSTWQYLNTSDNTLETLGFGDFDGNGTTDVFLATGNEWLVSFDGVSSWEDLNNYGYKLNNLGFGDFNGDGSTDIMRTSGRMWFVSWSGTSKFHRLNKMNDTLENLRFGDFDGDGSTDVIRTTGSNWYVSWSGMSAWEYLNSSEFTQSDLGFGDFNGDLKTDIIVTGLRP